MKNADVSFRRFKRRYVGRTRPAALASQMRGFIATRQWRPALRFYEATAMHAEAFF